MGAAQVRDNGADMAMISGGKADMETLEEQGTTEQEGMEVTQGHKDTLAPDPPVDHPGVRLPEVGPVDPAEADSCVVPAEACKEGLKGRNLTDSELEP